jgi:hypothetical protein
MQNSTINACITLALVFFAGTTSGQQPEPYTLWDPTRPVPAAADTPLLDGMAIGYFPLTRVR